MSQHQLEEADLGGLFGDEEELQVCGGDEGLYIAGRLPKWISRLAWNIADLNNAQCFVQSKGKMRSLSVVGRERDLSLIRYMFLYIKNEIESLCTLHASGRGTRWRNSFKLGATDEIVMRMKEAREKVFGEASSTALARLGDEREKAREWLEKKKPRTSRCAKSKPSRDAYLAGRVVGREIQLDSGRALQEPASQLEESA
jgi:hypothetical protein